MIITTYDILKRELADNKLFDTATGWQIAKQAQPQPPVRVVNRYDNAERILRESKSSISGRKLLETINFLSEAEVVATQSNIIKSFIKDPEDFHKVQDELTKALDDLVEGKILLSASNAYRITSDLEQRLLDEMIGFSVRGYVKKDYIVSAYKSALFIKSLAQITDGNLPYNFYITTDSDDELTNPPLKSLKLKLKSVYTMSDDRTAYVEALKVQSQNEKDLIWLVPDNSSFPEMDRLIDEIKRFIFLEDNYKNPKAEEIPILSSFATVKSEKEIHLKDLVEQSLQKATSIYLYNTFQLDKENWQSTLQSQQRKVIQNVYYRRLGSQLSDEVAGKVIKEATNTRLHTYFPGADFHFFDAQGNFSGEKLKVAEEILIKIGNTFVDGATLEKDLAQPPTGFAFGTVISTVAALMRGGKIMAKYNGSEKFSWRDEGVSGIFANATAFRKASFKAIAKSLSAQQKNEIVTALQGLKCEEHLGKKIDWNTNDFDLINAVRELAKRFCDKVDDMRKQNKDLETLFPELEAQKEVLGGFTRAISAANYIEKAENFLSNKEAYNQAVQAVELVEKFIRDNLPKFLKWKLFVSEVCDELTKSAKPNKALTQLSLEFNTLSSKEVVKNLASIQQTAQKIKDEYFELMQNAARDMAEKYTQLKIDAEKLIKEISRFPARLNDDALSKSKTISQYADQRIQAKVEIDYEVKDKHSRFTYSEMLSFIELYQGKKTDLEILKSGLIKEAPPKSKLGKSDPAPIIKPLTTNLPPQKLKVSEYKQWLHQELHKLAGASDNDEIEIKEG